MAVGVRPVTGPQQVRLYKSPAADKCSARIESQSQVMPSATSPGCLEPELRNPVPHGLRGGGTGVGVGLIPQLLTGRRTPAVVVLPSVAGVAASGRAPSPCWCRGGGGGAGGRVTVLT